MEEAVLAYAGKLLEPLRAQPQEILKIHDRVDRTGVDIDIALRVLENLAVPYRVDKKGHATRNDIPFEGINGANGLVSTVRDLAQFDFALDDGLLLRDTSLAAAWTPAQGNGGAPLPAGLGWFVQTYRGVQIVWQYGVIPNAYSGMIVKIPSRRVTMILLANSDGHKP